jgi:transposase
VISGSPQLFSFAASINCCFAQSLFDATLQTEVVGQKYHPFSCFVLYHYLAQRRGVVLAREIGCQHASLIAHPPKLSMIPTVTNQGKTRWMIIGDAFDADKLIGFLAALIKDAGKKVFLILDNLRVHHSKVVKTWVAERVEQIEPFYLPSYSPQLNPEERLNTNLKQEMGEKIPVRTKSKLARPPTSIWPCLTKPLNESSAIRHDGG